MQNRLRGFAALLLALAVVLGKPAAPVMAQELEGEVVAEGFNGPQGVLVAPDGSVYVVDSGVGGDNEMEAIAPTGETVTATYGDTARIVQVAPDGTQTEVAVLPSVFSGEEAIGGARVALVNDELYVTSGGWIDDGSSPPNVLPNTAAVLRVGADGSLEEVVPTWRMENRMNPDNAIKESHPYGIVGTADGKLLVADAGANTLIRIDPATGTVELVTTFPAIPGVFPNPDRGGEMLADPVPTGVDVDPDGNAYVSLLSGAPFVPGSAKVIKVTPAGARTDYATNLTMLTDLRFGSDGNIYAVQFAVFTDQGPTPNSGAIVRVLPGDRSVPVVTGLSFPTSVDFSEAGDAYVVTNGVGAPGSGALVRYAGFTAAAEEAVNAAAPSVTVNDQESDGTSVTVASVKAPEDGWMVIHADADGQPGAILGQTAVPAGTTENVVVMLETPLESDATVWAMLHTDKGEAGVYEFPDGPDIPVSWNGAIVVAPLNVALTEGMAATPEAPEEPAPAAAAEGTPEATEEPAEEAATPEATEEAAEEAATPEATEEAMEEAATPAATEEAMEEVATPEATEEAMEEGATPGPTEEAMAEAAPETLPRTGASQPSGVATLAVVAGIGALAAGSLLLRRRRA